MRLFKFIFIWLCFVEFSWCQEHPPIQNFGPKDYGAENQNWSITQDENKLIYVANNKGLLEYNGESWTLYPSPNKTIVRSVKYIDDKIYTGFYMDFGFWVRDEFGKLVFTSLVKTLDINVKEDEQFWNILKVDDWILFQSLERIYLYNTKNEEYKVINSPFKISKIFKVDNSVFFQMKEKGIYIIDQGKENLFSDYDIFKKHNIIDIFNFNEQLLVLTDTEGIFSIQNNKVTPWDKSSSDLNNRTIYNSSKLSNGNYLLGTISDGLLYMNRNGEIFTKIQQKDGINNNTVLSIFEDVDKNIWLALDNGVSIINSSSNIKIYKNYDGALGTVYRSIVYNGFLYLGTNQGLFSKRINTSNPFKYIERTQGQVWNLSEINGEIFCSHDSGIFVIKNNSVSYKIHTQGTWNVKKAKNNLLISGDYTGLSVLEKKFNKWRIRNKIQGFTNSAKYFELLDQNKVFVNHEYKGVFKLTIDSDFKKVVETTKDTSIAKGLHSSIVKYRGNIIYGNSKGVFKFNTSQNTFIKDNVLSKIYSDSSYVSGKLIYEKERDILWGFSNKHISYVTTGKLTNKPTVHKIPLKKSLREGATGYENITLLPSGKNLKGSYNGYLLFDIKNPPINSSNLITINSVETKSIDGVISRLNFKNDAFLNNEENNIEFYFSVPNYNVYQDIEYQYQLVGQSKSWSNWSNSSSVRFENLKYGSYTFQVKSKNGDTISERVASYSFTIEKPWYLSNLMVLVYVLVFILLIAFIQALNRRHYKKKAKKQIEKKQREFKLQELEKEKELVLLKNDQLKLDVESKNRELATSTMSMIKKNEFLNTIKNELKKVDTSNSINRVIRIIDKNLNDNDDWKLFEEAFNNADKGFIKKIKSMHSELTPNDLKLCAYLRLNLHSKEIAPLLNISPRSVEVKRYRLRKKMNLDHKENLTDYILSI